MSLLYSDTTSPLSERQQARAEALLAARQVLVTKTGFLGTNISSSPDVLDLHALAVYIETGNDPWKPATTAITEGN